MVSCFIRIQAVYLIFAITVISMPHQAWAIFISTGPADVEQADRAAAQRALESRIVEQRLVDLGLSREEAAAKTARLTNEQIHAFASNLDSLQAGAGGVNVLVLVLFTVVIAIGVLNLTGHSVIVR